VVGSIDARPAVRIEVSVMMKRQEMWARRAAGALVVGLLAAGATGCVETALYEKTALDLDVSRRENGQKEQQIRALQWQLASAGQQMQAISQQDATVLADLDRRMQEATAANRALADRLKEREEEAEKLRLAVARAEDEAASKHGPVGPTIRLRPDELRRIEAAASSRDPEMSKLLGRLEKILADRAARAAVPGERPQRVVDSDLVDPWNGDRK
jgi:chromosome segregation ATPase